MKLPLLFVVLAVVLLITSGCGTVATSWTGITVDGNRLYAANLASIDVLSTEDGSEIWSFPTNPEGSRETFYVAPAVGEGYVVVASKAPPSGFLGQDVFTVWGLDEETGRDLWSFTGASGEFVEGGAIGSGVFVIGGSDGIVYALDLETGELMWTFETGHRVWATPLIVDAVVYIGSADHHLYALDLRGGEQIWAFEGGGAFAGAPALWENTLFIGAFDDTLYAVSLNSGSEVWRLQSDNWFWGSPVLYTDTLYAVDVGGRVYAIDAESGEEIWRRELEEAVRAGPAVSEEGTLLFVSTELGTLYALDTLDGYELWSNESDSPLYSGSIVSGSIVYQPLLYGDIRIKALQVENGREAWIYPLPEDE